MPKLTVVNDLVTAQHDGLSQLVVDPLGHSGGVRLLGDVLEQHGEFVAAEAGQRVARAHARFQPARDGHQQLVARLMAQAVVDAFEPIDVQVQHREQRRDRRAPARG